MKAHEFAGGYIKTSEGVVKDRGVGAHLKRHAGAYTGTLIAPVLGTGIGALIDAARKKNNIIKTSEMEPPVSDRTAALLGLRGPVLMGRNDIKPALRELAARSEKITEFARGSYAREVLHRIGAMQKMPADSSVVKYALIKQPHPKFSGPAFPEKFGISGMSQVRDAAALEIRDARKKQRALNSMIAERRAQRAVPPSPFAKTTTW